MKDYNLDEMFKQVKKDTLDEEFHKFYTKTLNSLPNKKRKLNKSIIASASVFLIAILSFSPIVLGGDMPILKTIKNIFFAPEEYVKYAQGIDTKVDLGNFRVSLHDIIYDNDFLIYSYTVSKLDGKPFTQDEEMAGVSLYPVFKTTENFGGSEFNRVKNNPSEITIIRYDNIVEFCKELELNQYKDSKTITIKVYDTRNGKELDGSSVSFDIPLYSSDLKLK